MQIWATWCGYCQNPMANNQKLIETYGEKWGDRVRIIGLSVDKKKPIVEKWI